MRSASTAGADADGSPQGFDRRLLPPLVAGAILNPVNSTIVSVALVPIGAAFHVPPSTTVWLISALYLATAVGQPVVGRLIDLFGPRRLFLPATALVALAGVLGSLAPNLGVLIAARVLLGFGTCAGYPAAMRLIQDEGRRTGDDRPAGVLAVLAVATQTISVVGPVLGGLLIGLDGWRATMLVNIPLAITAFVLGWARFPKDADKAPPGRLRNLARVIDLPGMVLFAVTVVAMLLALMEPRHWWLLPCTLVAATAFTLRERACDQPFIDVRLLAGNRPLLLTYLRALLVYLVTYSFLYGLTQWLQEGRGLRPAAAGLMTLPMFAASIGVSALTGRREAVRAKLLATGVSQLAGCLLLLLLGSSTPVWLVAAVLMVFGIPQGLGGLALQNSVYREALPDSVASSAGLLRTFGYLGAIASSAASGHAYGAHADTRGMHHLALLLVGVSAAFLALCLVQPKPSREVQEAQQDAGETSGPL